MKRILLSFLLVLMTFATIHAQQISVVSSDGSTNMYQTLTEAIQGASDGSTIYLPGGGFQIPNHISIHKKITIIGIGHNPIDENPDGNTTISGNVVFDEGSSGSAIMGCYVSGSIMIGYYPNGGEYTPTIYDNEKGNVNNITVKYCNVLNVNIGHSGCSGTIINQNYIRSTSAFGNASANLTNNVLHSIDCINGGTIAYNIILGNFVYDYGPWSSEYRCMIRAFNSTITQNIFSYTNSSEYVGSENIFNSNISVNQWGGDNICITDYENYFVKNAGITPSSNFHLNENYTKYENQCGIYAGTGFKDNGMAPVPYIVSKSIPDQTDAEGKLSIKVRVKAGN